MPNWIYSTITIHGEINDTQKEILEKISNEGLCKHYLPMPEELNITSGVILNKNFDLFFEKFPKEELIEEMSPQKELPLPRVIEVRNGDGYVWEKRVVILFKDDRPLCWNWAETLEEVKKEACGATLWKQWREIQPESEYKPYDFSDGIGEHLDLIGKKIISKDSESCAMVINKISYDGEFSKSLMNDINAVSIFEYYTFEDGSPVGIRIEN